MVGLTASKAWSGKATYIVQFRGNERVWAGAVVATRLGDTCYGKRVSDQAFGQWKEGDILLLGDTNSNAMWKQEDTVKLGSDIEMFDDTLVRLDKNEYSSVTQALQALNSGVVRCEEGLCLCYSDSQGQFFMLAREDRKNEALQLFGESRDLIQPSKL